MFPRQSNVIGPHFLPFVMRLVASNECVCVCVCAYNATLHIGNVLISLVSVFMKAITEMPSKWRRWKYFKFARFVSFFSFSLSLTPFACFGSAQNAYQYEKGENDMHKNE